MKILVLAAFVLSLISSARAADRPNILLVLSDDHSGAHLGCAGNKDIRTPNLDRFAAQGMRFDRAYVASPQCVPSRAALMTGRSPIAVLNTRFSAPLAAEFITYPERLRASGYFTGICGRNFHLDGSARMPDDLEQIFAERGLRTFAKRVDFLRSSNQQKALGEMREFFDLKPAEKPFFLQLGFNDPHRPLARQTTTPPLDPAALTLPAQHPDTPAVREDFARYLGEIEHLDATFGEVLAELEQRGLAQNTLVVFMGDNGSAQFRGKGTLYEFGVRVPLLARWPAAVKSGGASAELISGEDLAPTFLAAAGAPIPPEMTGRSFLPLLRGAAHTGRKMVFSQRSAHGSSLPNGSAAFDLGRCVITRTHKLIYNALWQLPYQPVDFSGDAFWKELQQMHTAGKLLPLHARLYFSPTRPMFELYDLEKDPNEFENLAGQPAHAGLEHELRVALSEWMLLERDYVPLPLAPKPQSARRP